MIPAYSHSKQTRLHFAFRPQRRLIQRQPRFIRATFIFFFQKSFSARAVSRSHQRAEHILKNLQQEEEKRRLGREASIISAIPVAQEACYEPTCSPPPEQEEEGGVKTFQQMLHLFMSLCPDVMLLFCVSDFNPASRRSGEPDIPPSVRQPVLRLQQLPQELLFPPRLRVVDALNGER